MIDYGVYPKFYARRKSLLFPLMEKYSGISMKGKTHAEAIAIYLNLLKSDATFVQDLNALIAKEKFHNAIDPVTALGNAVSGVFGFLAQGKVNDQQFAEAVIAEQRAKNTQTILIVGGITLASLALIGVAIFMAVKKK